MAEEEHTEEAAEEEPGLDRIDVREPGQVTDDRADAGAAAAAGGEQCSRLGGSAHLDRDLFVATRLHNPSPHRNELVE